MRRSSSAIASHWAGDVGMDYTPCLTPIISCLTNEGAQLCQSHNTNLERIRHARTLLLPNPLHLGRDFFFAPVGVKHSHLHLSTRSRCPTDHVNRFRNLPRTFRDTVSHAR